MRSIILLFLLFSIGLNCQNENVERNFKFFFKNRYVNTKKLKVLLIKDSDTVDCQIKKEKIIVPKSNTYNILIIYRKKSYEIKNVDFSKLRQFPEMRIGIENSMSDFRIVSNENKNLYMHTDSTFIFKIDDFDDTKQICFVIFHSKKKNKNEILHKAYSRYNQY